MVYPVILYNNIANSEASSGTHPTKKMETGHMNAEGDKFVPVNLSRLDEEMVYFCFLKIFYFIFILN
jgi:hypothetical protein